MNKIKSKKLPKILIAIPTYDGKNYCLEAFLENINNFTYPKDRLQIYVADNSKDNTNALMLNRKYGLKVFWKDYSGHKVMEKIADSHNQLRRYFLESDCKYMFHLESDIFPPKDIIEQLLWCRKPIVNGMYQVFDGALRTSCLGIFDDKFPPLSSEFKFCYNLSNFHHYYIDGKVNQCFIAGVGCCLMKRGVMEKVKFRSSTSSDQEDEDCPPDTYFSEDLRNAGIRNWVNTGVLCFHWNREDWGRHSELIQNHKVE
jgi:GT2 family glycosyltransferase